MKKQSCYLVLAAALLLITSCHKGKDYTPALIGKWRSAKPKTEELIKEVKKEAQARGLPEQLYQPTIDQLKKAKDLTSDCEFKGDQTGSLGQTGQKPLPFTWQVVRKKGSTLVLSMDVMGDQKSLEIVFRDDDHCSMRFLEEDKEYEDPPVEYTRIRE
jgi:hypothetical protein